MGNTETPRRERDAGCGAGRAATFGALAAGSDRYKGPGRADEDRCRKCPGDGIRSSPRTSPSEAEPACGSDPGRSDPPEDAVEE